MTEVACGVLEVGLNKQNEVVINHPDLKPDENGVGHIVFSIPQAKNLSRLLLSKAQEAQREIDRQEKAERLKSVPPVDRSARVMIDGSPETPDHREIEPATGMQKGYIVLSAEERAKGFVRPVRRSYNHLTCRTTTTMEVALAETYARDPGFYAGTFCCHCRNHFPLDQFVWSGTTETLGA
jgi:hypothetical protein